MWTCPVPVLEGQVHYLARGGSVHPLCDWIREGING